MPQPEWWATFFRGAALQIWREAVNPEMTRSEVDFIVERLGLQPEDRVLDVPCGHGRHCLELAARGFRPCGVDLCAEFIDEARAAAAERALQLELTLGDMRDLRWRERFDGAICFGNSFAYLADEGNSEFLRAVAATLRPGAGFLLQTGAAAESVLPEPQERTWHRAGRMTMLTDSSYDPLQGKLSVEYGFLDEGAPVEGIERKTATYRVYTVLQICEMLRRSGFLAPQTWGDLQGHPYEAGDRVLYLLARKG